MPFSNSTYDPETLALLQTAFDAAWEHISGSVAGYSAPDVETVRKLMAVSIMRAVDSGERDLHRLTFLAVQTATNVR